MAWSKVMFSTIFKISASNSSARSAMLLPYNSFVVITLEDHDDWCATYTHYKLKTMKIVCTELNISFYLSGALFDNEKT